MRLLSLSLLFFCSFSSAVSLTETTAATGIANTLNSASQSNPKKHLNKAKAVADQYNQHISEQQNQLNSLESQTGRIKSPELESTLENFKPRGEQPIGEDSFTNFKESESSGQKAQNELDINSFRDNNINEEARPVDYTVSSFIFYKKDCPLKDTSCKRSGPVFTNIKSVIFNYEQGRMDYSKKEK